MSKKGLLFGGIGAAVVAVVVCLVLLLTGGEEAYRSIQVFEIDGTCTVTRDNDKLDAYKNMKLQSGDKFEVGDGSYARLKLDDDKYVYLQAATKIAMTAEGTANDSKTIIFVENGSMTTEVQRKLSATSSYDIVTPNTTMSIRGTTIQSRVSTDAAGNVTTDSCVLEGQVEYKAYEADESGNIIAVPVELPKGEPKSIKTEASKVVESEKLIDIISNDKKDETTEKTVEEAGIEVEAAVFTADDFVGVQGELASAVAEATIKELLGQESEPEATPEVTPEATPEPQNNTADGPLTNDDIGDIVYVDTPAGGETADNDSDLTNTIDTGSQDNTDDTYVPTTPTPEQDDNDTNQGQDNDDDNSGSTTGDNTDKDDKDDKDNKGDKDKDDKDDVTPTPELTTTPTPEPTVTPAPTGEPDPTSAPDPTTTPAPTNTPDPEAVSINYNIQNNITVNGHTVTVEIVKSNGTALDSSDADYDKVNANSSKNLPGTTNATNGYKVKVSEGYEFVGWFTTAAAAADPANNTPVTQVTGSSTPIVLYPGVKVKTCSVTIINTFTEAASFELNGTSWTEDEDSPGNYVLNNIPYGTIVKLPVLTDLYGDTSFGFGYSDADNIGKIQMTNSESRSYCDFVCYSTNSQLDLARYLTGGTISSDIPTSEIRLVNDDLFGQGESINQDSMSIEVTDDIVLNAYFASAVGFNFAYLDYKINLGSSVVELSNISEWPNKLGTSTYWKKMDPGSLNIMSYYYGKNSLELPGLIAPNSFVQKVNTEMKYEYQGSGMYSQPANITNGGLFAASGEAGCPFDSALSSGKSGGILISPELTFYVTLKLDNYNILSGNQTTSGSMGILKVTKGTECNYFCEIELGMDSSNNIKLPDQKKAEGQQNATLAGRAGTDNPNNYLYLDKSNYELAGYKVQYALKNGETSEDYTSYESFGGALFNDESGSLKYYVRNVMLDGDSKVKDFSEGITITPIFRSVTPFSFTSDMTNRPSVLTANASLFNLVISNIDTNYVKEIDLSNIRINAIRNDGSSGIEDIACDSDRLLITNEGIKLVNSADAEITESGMTYTNGDVITVSIPVNSINATTGKYSDYFCFGISQSTEAGSYIGYKNIFDVECGDPSGNTNYKKPVVVADEEKYHYLGLSLGDNSGNIKLIDNFNDRYTDTREFLKYTYNGTTGFVGGAIYGGRVLKLRTSSLVTEDGTDGDFAPTYDYITEQDYLDRYYNKPLSFNDLVGDYYAGLAKIDKYTKISLRGEDDRFNCKFVTGTSDTRSQEVYIITNSERIDYDCRPSDWDNIYFTSGSKHYFVSLGDGSISSLDDDASV